MAAPWHSPCYRSAQEARALVVERPARKTLRCLLLAMAAGLSAAAKSAAVRLGSARRTINLRTRRIDDRVA